MSLDDINDEFFAADESPYIDEGIKAVEETDAAKEARREKRKMHRKGLVNVYNMEVARTNVIRERLRQKLEQRKGKA